jgi:hypothetical protein
MKHYKSIALYTNVQCNKGIHLASNEKKIVTVILMEDVKQSTKQQLQLITCLLIKRQSITLIIIGQKNIIIK